jgi:hypothetical protein
VRTRYAAALLVLLVAGAVGAAPPELVLPKEVTGEPGDFVSVPAKTAGKTVQWKAIDAGLKLFPVELLKDSKTAVVSASRPGRYRLLAVTAAGDEVSPFAETVVVIGGVEPIPPPQPKPDPKPDPAPGPAKSFRAFLVYESAKPMTPAQVGVVYGREVEAYLDARTGGSWQRRDKDTDPAADTTALKSFWAAAKPKVVSVPSIATDADGVVTVTPIAPDATPAGVVAALKMLAGDK